MIPNYISSVAAEAWSWIAGFLNSNFTAALAGAFAGAMAAQRISERAKERDSLLNEIRSINAAIMVAFGICNSGLSLKKQFVKDVHDTYHRKKAELQDFHQRRQAGLAHPDQPFQFQADLRTFHLPALPTHILQTQIFERMSASGRVLALTASLLGAADALGETMTRRAALVERFKALKPEEQPLMPALYFSLPMPGGHITTEFADTVDALFSLTNDIIFFGELLVQDLRSLGSELLTKYNALSPTTKMKIHELDFSQARALGLMPNSADYEDWLKGFPASRPAVAEQAVPGDAPAARERL